MPLWHRLIVVGVVVLFFVVVARLIDRRIARRELSPETITRYRVVRRSVTTAIIFVGLLSALPATRQVRAVRGALPPWPRFLGSMVGSRRRGRSATSSPGC